MRASVVCQLQLPLMNSFYQAGAALYSMQAMLASDFPFSSINVEFETPTL